MSGPTYICIDERIGLSRETFIKDYLSKSRPVVIKDGAKSWPAVKKWTPEWFERTYSEVEVPIAVGPRRRISEYRVMKIGEYVSNMRTTKPKQHMYLRQFNIFDLLPNLLNDVPDPYYCPSDRELIRNFWMGTDTLQPLHHDAHSPIVGTCNIFAQIYGRKRVILAAPDQTPYLYKQADNNVDSHLSEVDIEAPDFERFPLLVKATLWACNVERGDLLLIPLNFWHFMKSFGASISVSFWWHPHALSELAFRLLRLSERDPDPALQVIRENAGIVKMRDVEELGGIEHLREALGRLPSSLRGVIPLLFDERVREALARKELS